MTTALDIAGTVLLLLGAFLALGAAIGLIRMPDVLDRMHAASKPQSLGILLVLLGLGLYLREPAAIGMLVLIAVLQVLTAPVAAHIVSRTAYRTRQQRSDLVVVDELARDLAKAGYELSERAGPVPHASPDETDVGDESDDDELADPDRADGDTAGIGDPGHDDAGFDPPATIGKT
ncbi:monovalent cation/H(+) antiporter subunit G [Nakamurella aerolata]|uniref:monovalent cation/H(+) antiporter subunit G n=1 Tax=Nakamurella aerolata TaxID=1656892 RepID=UPI001BB18FB2|nr:monovalent cation/H(+) antiporter subunit G [Nakamurella aerolata]